MGWVRVAEDLPQSGGITLVEEHDPFVLVDVGAMIDLDQIFLHVDVKGDGERAIGAPEDPSLQLRVVVPHRLEVEGQLNIPSRLLGALLMLSACMWRVHLLQWVLAVASGL